MKTFLKITFFVSLFFFSCKPVSEKQKYVVGISQFSLDNSLRKAMVHSMKVEANFHKELELLIVDGEGSVDKQIEDIENLIKQKVDVLIVSPIATKPLRATVQKAIKENIPVIVIDREFEGINYNVFIGADNYEIGQNSANYLISLKEPMRVIEIKGWAGTSTTLLRSQGFKSIVDYSDQLELVGVVQDIYNSPGIKDSFKKEILASNTSVNAVFAHTDELALQAYEAAKELKLENTIKFIGVGGVNGENEGLDLVQREVFEATVLHPTGGKEIINVAKKIITKDTNIQREYLLPSLIIDKQNVGVLKRQLDLITEQEADIEKQQNNLVRQLEVYSSQSSFLKYTLLFLLLIAGLLFLTFRAKQKEKKQKLYLKESNDVIELQKQEIEKIAEDLRINNEATNNFFTGVSHDFKTPVSLIMSSTESLLDKSTKNPKEYALIHNNSKRLLRMINELLDFKRVESKKFRLKVVETNIYDFLYSIFLDFEYETENNKIDFSITTNTKEAFVFIDRNLFDNIFFNLLSNALKFTPIGGSIKVTLNEVEDKILISVKDSGIGIVDAEKEKVFQQFFQGSNNKQTSSGVGLYLTKEYIQLHGGDVKLISEVGKGSEFTLSIPKGSAHFKTEEIIIDAELPSNDSIDMNTFEFENTIITKGSNEEHEESILIIEDNTDLRLFLKNKLSESYNVYESEGIDAIEKAFDIIPDIIISDVNLPEKNGFEITKILKNDERTSHIPTIILTALSSDDAHLKGLKSGVDMFLTKPFNLSVLNQSIQSLLYNRKKLQYFYKKQQLPVAPIEEVKKPTVEKESKTSLEQAFLEKMNVFIENNIDDSSFTVEVLADKLGISRVQLYRKVKAVLGVSISDVIQEKRLEKSKALLLDDSLSIADVAYSIGFSSPNYFSTAFKNKFGKTPNMYKKEQKRLR